MSQRLDPEGALREALARQEQGDTEAAVARCREILARHPEHAVSLNLLGVVSAQAGDRVDAIEMFGRAVIHDPGSPCPSPPLHPTVPRPR